MHSILTAAFHDSPSWWSLMFTIALLALAVQCYSVCNGCPIRRLLQHAAGLLL